MSEFLGIAILVVLTLIVERVGVLTMLKSIGNLALIAIWGCAVFAVIRTFITAGSWDKTLAIILVVAGILKLWDKVTDWYWDYLLNHPTNEPAPPEADAGSTASGYTSDAQARQR